MAIETFHPDAARNFEEKGAALLSQLVPGDLSVSDGPAFPQPYIAAEFTEANIQSFGHFSRVDKSGQEMARFFEQDGQVLGFEGESYVHFVRLCESLHKTKVLNRVLSFETCRQVVFDWVKHCFAGGNVTLPAFVERQRDELVAEHTIVLPIHELLIQAPLSVGRIELRPLTETQIDGWLDDQEQRNPDFRKHRAIVSEKLRKPFQGRAASWFTTRAEERRAFEIAQTETRRALSVLRLFSKAAFLPDVASFCVPWGEQHVLREYHLTIRDGSFHGSQDRLIAPLGTFWELPKTEVDYFWGNGLEELSNLLQVESPSPIELALIHSVLVYSRATLTPDPTEKLLHMFVALESLLLKDENEPVVSSISERFSFLAGRSVEERLEISAIVKQVYRLRSRYVHHALPVDDHERVGRFMLHAWAVLMALVRSRHHHSEVAEMHAALERRKFQ